MSNEKVEKALSIYKIQASQDLDFVYSGGDKDAVFVATTLAEAFLERGYATFKDLPLDEYVRRILGMICTQCIDLAKLLRDCGYDIKHKAEDEQATVIHWMLSFYLVHGKDWEVAFKEDIAKKIDSVRAKVQDPEDK